MNLLTYLLEDTYSHAQEEIAEIKDLKKLREVILEI